MNLYAYVSNKPTNSIDREGRLTLAVGIGFDQSLTKFDPATFGAQKDKFIQLMKDDCNCTASVTVNADNDNGLRPKPPKCQYICTASDNTVSDKIWDANIPSINVKNAAVKVMFTHCSISFDGIGARAATRNGIGFIDTYIGDKGIFSHELGHFVGYKGDLPDGHSSDPKNIMHKDAPNDGKADQQWCDKVKKILK